MHYEVEQKFRVTSFEPTISALAAMDVHPGEPQQQVDCYYAHPVTDFAKTDEAFRLRAVGERNYMTYKGPKIDKHTKTRTEEEVRLADGPEALAACDEIVRHLSFKPVAVVRKERKLCTLERDGLSVEVALDQVDHVGQFVEIEVSVPFASPIEDTSPMAHSSPLADFESSAVASAQSVLERVATELGVAEVERRSYLELLLEATAKD